MTERSAYVRIATKILNGNRDIKRKKMCRFIDGKLVVGNNSLSKTQASRTWRLFWRIKSIGR